MSPDLSKTRKPPLHQVIAATRGPRSSRLRLLGLVLLLALFGFTVHHFGPEAAKYADPAALQKIFESAVRFALEHTADRRVICTVSQIWVPCQTCRCLCCLVAWHAVMYKTWLHERLASITLSEATFCYVVTLICLPPAGRAFGAAWACMLWHLF